jgi:hypothetical protein
MSIMVNRSRLAVARVCHPLMTVPGNHQRGQGRRSRLGDSLLLLADAISLVG